MQQERLTATLTAIALRIKRLGGNRIAQETAVIYAKQLLKDGKSAATALDKGVKAGMNTFKRCNCTFAA